jgi:hypothetical protein
MVVALSIRSYGMGVIKMKKKMRMRVTKERLTLMTGNPLGLLFVRVQKLMVMCMVCVRFT